MDWGSGASGEGRRQEGGKESGLGRAGLGERAWESGLGTCVTWLSER
ncbi:hypothetical protein N9Z67_01805 [Rhodopirellula sp.]|nr:hypothetical protein [Rhodopirellula sp.]